MAKQSDNKTVDDRLRTDKAEDSLSCKAGKYLTFQLGSEVYGIEILKVQEIIGIMKITRVPKTPQEIRGVINLRGQVIAVVDLRLRFDMEAQADTDRTCITVVQTHNNGKVVTMGVVVDNVCEVLDIEASQIEPAPSFGQSVDTNFILGIAKVEDNVVTMLDIDCVLSSIRADKVEGAVAEEELAASA